MNIRIFNDKEELYREAANFFIDHVKENPNAILGLATGATPIPLYQNLILDHKENKTDYSKVKSFNLDEYIGLPKDHKETYYNFMNENLFKYINIKETYVPNGDPNKKEQSCLEYENLISNNQIEIQLLGLGANGHIGFNEPLTPFDSKTHIVTLANKTREDNARFFNSLDEVPKEAITMGIASIMKAKTLILLAVGENKADAIYEMIYGKVSTECPASILQTHSDCYVFIDRAAASKINK
ncbi:glucosamine-6-phosphate deaminase [Acholeplasma sp. OttesenSCG-928-E16]|nr:glucosamine-6-phosphate deaminase [Acholeplasma sp. OttesenSCG-928-E16]